MSPELSENSDPGPASRNSRWKAHAGNALIMLFSVIMTLFVAEFGYRMAMGVPVFDLSDWRAEKARTNRIGERAMLDPHLGWTLRPNHKSPGFNTTEDGFRRNFTTEKAPTGAILAVGDSFTEGFDEVTDDGTWPAHLEKILGARVVNGGVAGYASDQIVLKAEQLLPVLQPKTLIVGFTEVDIYRAALSDAGAPKPYFTVENDELVYHPPSAFENRAPMSASGRAFRNVLGRSALADHLFSRLSPAFWYPEEAALYNEIENQPLDVSCRLLARLKQKADAQQTRMLVFLQHAGELVLEEPAIVDDMRMLSECTQKAGIEVVDHFGPLQAVTNGNPNLVALYYTPDGAEFGHMTSKGNEHAAQLLASALRAAPPQIVPPQERPQEALRH